MEFGIYFANVFNELETITNKKKENNKMIYVYLYEQERLTTERQCHESFAYITNVQRCGVCFCNYVNHLEKRIYFVLIIV